MGQLQVKTHALSHAALAASTAYSSAFDAIYVGTTGNIDVTIAGTEVTYSNVLAGVIHPISGDSIAATTTADDMVVINW